MGDDSYKYIACPYVKALFHKNYSCSGNLNGRDNCPLPQCPLDTVVNMLEPSLVPMLSMMASTTRAVVFKQFYNAIKSEPELVNKFFQVFPNSGIVV